MLWVYLILLRALVQQAEADMLLDVVCAAPKLTSDAGMPPRCLSLSEMWMS